MSRIVAVSPTLADAAMSVGGTLARHAGDGHEVVLVLVFEDDSGADMQDEVRQLLGLAGVVVVGHETVDDEDEDAKTTVGAALAVALSRLEPSVVLSPIGLGGHVDARILNEALDALDVPRLRWLDLPYGLSRTPGATLGTGELVAVPIGEHVDAKLAACALVGATVEAPLLRDHAIAEGIRLGTGGPVEILLRPAPAG